MKSIILQYYNSNKWNKSFAINEFIIYYNLLYNNIIL